MAKTKNCVYCDGTGKAPRGAGDHCGACNGTGKAADALGAR